jgi:hypothetical protein
VSSELSRPKGKYERNVSVKPVEGILPFGGAGLFKCVSDALTGDIAF